MNNKILKPLTKKLCVPKGFCSQCGESEDTCKHFRTARTIGEIIGCIIASGPI